MKMRIKRLLGILLSFSLVMGTMPGAPLTIHAGEINTSENVSSDTAPAEEGNREDTAPEEGNREDTASGNKGVEEPEVPSVPAVPEPEEEPAAGSQTVSVDTAPEEPVSVSAPVVSEPEIEENAGDGEHTDHNDITFQPWTSTVSLPNVAGDYYLTGDVTINETWTPQSEKTTRLCLNGYGIRLNPSKSGAVITIFPNEGTSLAIYDCNSQNREHYITLSKYRGTSVSDSGSETGIDSEGDGTVKVSGGYITGGSTTGNGGGVSVYRQFTMNGGTIIGNVISDGSSKNGGGVALCSSGSSFEMNGGNIMFNKCTGDGTYGGAYGGGAGVYVTGNSTFTMNGGVISGNKTTKGGGGVNIGTDGTFNLNGGLITQNISNLDLPYSGGGGIYQVWTSNLKVKGNPIVNNNFAGDTLQNVYISSGKTISIVDTLSSDACIGVTMQTPGVFTSSLSDKGTAKNFKSDNTNLAVYIEGGEAKLAHAHKMTYSVSGATITATCSNNNPTCTLPGEHKVTLTIMKPDRTIYGDGKSASASFNGLDDFNAATGFETTVSDISYKGRDGTTYGPSTTAPEAVGKYTASITVEEKTALVDYVISRGTAVVTTPPAANSLIYSGAAQALVTAGACTDTCTMKYALGTESAVTGSYSGSIPTGTDAGTYYVWYMAEGNDNYNDSAEAKVAVTLGKKSVTVNGITASDKTYDGTTDVTIDMTGVTFVGKVDGDTLTVTGTGAFSNKDAADNKTVNVTGLTLGGTSSGNYVLASTTSGCTANITPASLTVTANDNTITYGDAPANNGVLYSGFVHGETLADLSGPLAYDYTYSQYGNVGNYRITPKGYTVGNYTYNYVSGNLNVDQKEVGLNWPSTSLKYNGQPQKPTATATGTVNSDTVSVTVTGEQTNLGNAYTATATGLTGDKALNYKLPAANTTQFSIIKGDPKTLDSISRNLFKNSASVNISVYSHVPEDAGTVTGFTHGAAVTNNVTINNLSVNQAGTVSADLTGGQAGGTIIIPITAIATNYDCTFDLKITLVDKENPAYVAPGRVEPLIYNGAEQELITRGNVTKGGRMLYRLSENGVPSEDIPKGRNAGTYKVYYMIEETDTVAELPFQEIDVTIGRKAAAVKADDKSKTLSSNDPALTATVTGLVYGEPVSLISFNIARAAGEVPGNYAITPSGAAQQGNYSVTFVSGNFTIIDKERAEKPERNEFSLTDEKILGQENGSISGITKEMEYRYNESLTADDNIAGWGDWMNGTGQAITRLKPGSYEVRIKETDEKAASEGLILVIQKGQTSTITGTVVYKNGKVYPKAVVTVKNSTGYSRKFTTNEKGNFRVTGFAYGVYTFETTGEAEEGGKTASMVVETDALIIECDLEVPCGNQNEGNLVVTGLEGKTADTGIESVMVDVDDIAEDQKQDGSKITMTVTAKDKDKPYGGKDEINKLVNEVYGGATVSSGVLDISITKENMAGSENVDEISNAVEVILNYDFNNRFDVRVWRYHKPKTGAAQVMQLRRLPARATGNYEDGTCFIDKTDGRIFIYAKLFSIYEVTSVTSEIKYTVKFDSGSGTAVTPQTVGSGERAVRPSPDPVREGFAFMGWYADQQGTRLWDFENDIVNSNITLYAKWRSRGLVISGLKEEYRYTGSRIVPDLKVTYEGTPLFNPNDYTVTCKDNVNPGKATVIVKGKGNFKDQQILNFTIVKTDLSDTKTEPDVLVEAYRTNKKYNNLKPALYLDGVKLKLNTKFLTYRYIDDKEQDSECSAEGDYRIVIRADSGNPCYTGSVEIPLTVTTKPMLKSASVKLESPSDAMKYNGRVITPVFTLKLNGKQLEQDRDYTVSFNDAHIDPGTHKVTFIAKGTDYVGKKTVTFRITGKKDLSNIDLTKVTVADYERQFMTGGARPTVRVTYDGELLKQGRDFNVVYEDNTEAGSAAVCTVKGKGNFCGSMEQTFTVEKCDLGEPGIVNVTIDDRAESDKAGDYKKAPIRFMNMNGRTQNLKNGVDYVVSYNAVTSDDRKIEDGGRAPAGSKITAYITGIGKNYRGTTVVNYRIKGKNNDLSRARIKMGMNALYEYCGASIVPTEKDFEVRLGDSLIPSEGYEIVGCFNNVNSGTATVLIRGKGLYYGTKKATWRIDAMKMQSVVSSVLGWIFRK